MKIFAQTERLILREVLASDKAGFFELDSDPEVHKYLGNQPVKDLEQVKVIIQFIQHQYKENGIGRWAVVEKDTNQFVGWSGLKLVKENINNHINFYDLGYRFIKKYWGKGYATETARAALEYGFKHLQVNEIFAMTDNNNAASAKVLKKTGFTFIDTFHHEGVLLKWFEITKPR